MFTSRNIIRSFSSNPTKDIDVQSFREKLRNINPDANLLKRLDYLRLGRANKRQIRVHAAKNWEVLESTKRIVEKKKFPFFKPATPLKNIEKWDKPFLESIKTYPQIALIGRSNVGKSTLLNSLVGFDSSYVQKAAMSPKPGETKSLHFFGLGFVLPPVPEEPLSTTPKVIPKFQKLPNPNVTPKIEKIPSLVIVDMPGYGFSFMSEEDMKRCQSLTFDYLIKYQLEDTSPLKRVLLLLDARHGFKKADFDFFNELNSHFKEYLESQEKLNNTITKKKLPWNLQLVLTKCDLVDRIELTKLIQLTEKEFYDKIPAKFQSKLPVLAISAKEEKGIIQLQNDLSKYVPSNQVVFKARQLPTTTTPPLPKTKPSFSDDSINKPTNNKFKKDYKMKFLKNPKSQF